MTAALSWQDYAVILLYLTAMLALGAHLARHKRSDLEYFLAGRQMPWFAVGMSVIASLLSSLTYLSEPGEVWKSGITHVFGKMLAIPFEMLFVWFFCIPFMMRFSYTSAYEYLEDRYGWRARRVGVVLFVLMVVLWMGFVVLASAKALQQVSGVPLLIILLTVGAVATIYTMLGGLRAVIWTDVIQVILLVGGGCFAIAYVAWTTESGPGQWYAAAVGHLANSEQPHALPWFSANPFVRATVITVAANMCVWHICTHTANQMTVQRYFSTSHVRAARRSFVTASLFGVGINLMLTTVGLAMLFYYFGQGIPLEQGLDPEQNRDLIFPTFAVQRLPAGVGGGILAALLAAAMSSIDSGINSIATVISLESNASDKPESASTNLQTQRTNDHVSRARRLTLVAGTFITIAAYLLSFLPEQWGIVGSMPRTFNAITPVLGAMFLVGMFFPRVSERAMLVGVACGLATSIGMGYYEALAAAAQAMGLPWEVRALSFAWIVPSSLAVSTAAAVATSFLLPCPQKDLAGLTWYTRHQVRPSQNGSP